MKILLHTCCAPDFTISYKNLVKSNYEIYSYFYNPNINNYEEYLKRNNQMKILKNVWNFSEIDSYYNDKSFNNKLKESEFNCFNCIKMRLEKTIQKAKELKIYNYSTTLIASPRKSHKMILEIAEELDRKYKSNFIYDNFRKNNGINKISKMCRTYKIYRQKYCGCENSFNSSINLENNTRTECLEKLKTISVYEHYTELIKFYKKDIINIPVDISYKCFKDNFISKIELLKPSILLVKKEILKDLKIYENRIKINKRKIRIISY